MTATIRTTTRTTTRPDRDGRRLAAAATAPGHRSSTRRRPAAAPAIGLVDRHRRAGRRRPCCSASGSTCWTDALWFQSVGFDGVFWTRIGAQFGAVPRRVWSSRSSSCSGTCGWPAGSAPLRPTRRGGILRGRLRPAERGAPSGRGRRTGRSAAGRTAGLRRAARPSTFDADDMPDLTPIAGVGPGRRSAALIALTIGGSARGVVGDGPALDQPGAVLARPAPVATDPVFGRDISLLPVRAAVPAPRPGAVQRPRHRDADPRRGAATWSARRAAAWCSTTPVRVHLAVLGALFLLSVAFGYQLDKFELAYSTRGVATGVSYTDQNAQFVAFDLLTIISGARRARSSSAAR